MRQEISPRNHVGIFREIDVRVVAVTECAINRVPRSSTLRTPSPVIDETHLRPERTSTECRVPVGITHPLTSVRVTESERCRGTRIGEIPETRRSHAALRSTEPRSATFVIVYCHSRRTHFRAMVHRSCNVHTNVRLSCTCPEQSAARFRRSPNPLETPRSAADTHPKGRITGRRLSRKIRAF